jgi:hypothetical protein
MELYGPGVDGTLVSRCLMVLKFFPVISTRSFRVTFISRLPIVNPFLKKFCHEARLAIFLTGFIPIDMKDPRRTGVVFHHHA